VIPDFLRGVSYVPRGLRLLAAPWLAPYIWMPIGINVLVFAGLFWLAGAQYQALIAWLLPEPGTFTGEGWWTQTLEFLALVARWLLWPLFLLAAVVVMFYTFTAVANLVAAPFNGWLSARVERAVTGSAPAGDGGGLTAEVLGAFGGELRKIGYFALLGIPLLLLFLVPVANIAAPFLWTLYGAWILALEYMDYPLGNRGLGFPEQRVRLRRQRLLHLGFGAGILAMTLIPVLNLVAMPTGVIGATLLALENASREAAPRQATDR